MNTKNIFYGIFLCLSLYSCMPALDVPHGAAIACTADGDCPPAWVCNLTMGSCIPPGDNRPPKATVSLQPMVGGSRHVARVPMTVSVLDPNLNDTVSVALEFSLDATLGESSVWHPAQLADQDLQTIPQGQTRDVVWDVLAQAEAQVGGLHAVDGFAEDGSAQRWVAFVPSVTLRLRPQDHLGLEGEPMFSQTFALGNNAPNLDVAEQLPAAAGDVTVLFFMADTAGDIGAVELGFRLPGESDWRTAALLDGSGEGLFAPPQGATRTVIWQSATASNDDLSAAQGVGPNNLDDLRLRLRASDEHGGGAGRAYGPWVETTLGRLSNRSAPQVSNIEMRRLELADGQGPVMITYRVAEQEGQPVDIVFEYSPGPGGARLRCREYASPWSEGTVQLATRRPLQGGMQHQFIWDVSGTTNVPGMVWARAAGVGGASETAFNLPQAIKFEAPALIADNLDLPVHSPLFLMPSSLIVGQANAGDKHLVSYRRHSTLGAGLNYHVWGALLADASINWQSGLWHLAMARAPLNVGGELLLCHTASGAECTSSNDGDPYRMRVFSSSQAWPGSWLVRLPDGFLAEQEQAPPLFPSIAAGDFLGTGELAVAVGIAFSAHPLGGLVGAVYPLPQDEQEPSVHGASPVGGGFYGWPVAAVDVDGDGRDDLLTYTAGAVGSDSGGRTLLYLSDGAYGFVNVMDVAQTSVPTAFVANDGGAHVWVVKIDGQLQRYTYDPQAQQMALRESVNTGVSPSSLAVGDVTGDGIADVVVASRFPVGLTVFPGELGRLGEAVLSAPLFFSLAAPLSNFPQVKLAELDGKPPMEMVVVGDSLEVYRLSDDGMHRGGFGAPFRVSHGGGEFAYVGDIDLDGVPDLVRMGPGYEIRVQPLLRAQRNQEMDEWVFGAGIPAFLADVQGNGLLDVLGMTTFSSAAVVWHNRSDTHGMGEFAEVPLAPEDSLGIYAEAGALGDINGDGVLDIVAVSGAAMEELCVVLVPPHEDFVGPWLVECLEKPSESHYSSRPVLEDLTGDGRVNILVGIHPVELNPRRGLALYTACQSDVCLFESPQRIGNIAREWPHAPGHYIDTSISYAAVRDLNADGWPDIFFTLHNDPLYRLGYSLNQGEGDFSADVCFVPVSAWGSALPAGEAPQQMTLGDWNGDGIADVLLITPSLGVQVIFGALDGPATCPWAPASVSTLLLGLGATAVASADINGDGVLDLVSKTGWAVLGSTGSGALQKWSTEISTFSGGRMPALLKPSDAWFYDDAFGYSHRPSMVWQPALSSTMHLHQSTLARQRSGLEIPAPLRALTAEWYADGETTWQRVLHNGQVRWQERRRLGVGSNPHALLPFDLTSANVEEQHGIVLDLPWLDGLEIAGATIRVIRRSRDYWRATNASEDELYGQQAGLRMLPRVEGDTGERNVVRELIEWTEISASPGNQLAHGSGPRFVVRPAERTLRVLTDRLGWFQAYLQ